MIMKTIIVKLNGSLLKSGNKFYINAITSQKVEISYFQMTFCKFDGHCQIG